MMSTMQFVLLFLVASSEVEVDANAGFHRPAPQRSQILPKEEEDEIDREDEGNKKMSFVSALDGIAQQSPNIISKELVDEMSEKQAKVREMIELHKQIEKLQKEVDDLKEAAEDGREDITEQLYAYGRGFNEDYFEDAHDAFLEWKESVITMRSKEAQIAELTNERTNVRGRITELETELQKAFKDAEKRAESVVGLAQAAKQKFTVLRVSSEVLPSEGFPKGKDGKKGGEYLGLGGRPGGARVSEKVQEEAPPTEKKKNWFDRTFRKNTDAVEHAVVDPIKEAVAPAPPKKSKHRTTGPARAAMGPR